MRLLPLLFVLYALGLAAGGCVATPPPAMAPAPGADGEDRSALNPDEYSIGVADSLDIYVWRHDDLSRAIPVRPDGKISTPLVEDLQAAGKTPTQLGRDIEAILGEYIKNPKVTVIVTGFRGESRDQVRVIGQASQPRSIPYTQGMTLLDVLIDVGGLTEFAAPKRSKIVRRVNGKATEIPVRPDLLLEKGDIRFDIPLQAGDVLIIPEARF